ncbi:MAG: hypothetical protein VX835_02090 [Pseudomonadota bacterium]|nr:hypothetical protein [Pseudomonadota bacterium]
MNKLFNLKVFALSFLTLNAHALTVSGKIYSGLQYDLKNPSTTPTSEDHFSVATSASRLYFSENYFGNTGHGTYFLYEGDIFNDLANLHSFVGYRTNQIDTRLGKLDSLVYSWVGSLTNPWTYGSNISVIPEYNRYLSNSGRVVVSLGDQLKLGVNVLLNKDTRDYSFYDLGGKWSNNTLAVSTVYQENNKDSTTAFENRNTWASAISYQINKKITLNTLYTHYSNSYASNSKDDSFSVVIQNQKTYLSYQTSQNKDQSRVNLMHSIPLSDAASIGFEVQTPVNSKYYKDGATTKTDDASFAVIYLGFKF